jgi:hypothetical protein
MFNVYVINDKESFNKYFPLLQESSRVNCVHLVGFDIEFISQDCYPNPFKIAHKWVKNTDCGIAACIVQISTDKICLVINLTKLKKTIPKQLFKLISNESWIKMGVGIENDLKILSSNYNLGHCAGGIELKNLGILGQLESPNLANMYNLFHNSNVEKIDSMCDWSKDKLLAKELDYAAEDARMSYMLGKKMLMPVFKGISEVSDSEVKVKINTIVPEIQSNYIGKLQEYAQQNRLLIPEYSCTALTMHNIPAFKFVCKFNGKQTDCIDNSKKKAKQLVSKLMMDQLN